MLGRLGVDFEVVEVDVEELTSAPDPERLVLANARLKALAGVEATKDDPRLGEATVLGADTDVFVDGEALGQPAGLVEARRRLQALSGREHEVLSGVCLLGPPARGIPGEPPRERSGVACSRVTFRELDEAVLDAYLASREWRGRAGAYAIQGLGSILIDRVEGDFSNVVGLPVRLLLELDPALSAAASQNPEANV